MLDLKFYICICDQKLQKYIIFNISFMQITSLNQCKKLKVEITL